jgi:hypothetical protein
MMEEKGDEDVGEDWGKRGGERVKRRKGGRREINEERE